MTTRTFTHLYDQYDDATRTVAALERSGIAHSEISLVANNADSRHAATTTTATNGDAADTGTGTGATLGTLLGGGAGLAAGLGMLAIPGVGPVVAAGWLVATLTGAGVGAAGGGLLGSLMGAGVPEHDAHVYAEGVRRGGAIVTVRADDSNAAAIEAVLNQHGATAVDVATRRSAYASTDNWSTHDATATPYTAEQIAAERQRRM